MACTLYTIGSGYTFMLNFSCNVSFNLINKINYRILWIDFYSHVKRILYPRSKFMER